MSNSHLRLPLLATPAPESVGGGLDSLADLAAEKSAVFDGGDTSDDKLLQVGDLARESGKTVRALHLYEELDLLRPAARSKGRYRLYSADALVRIRWISKLQDMGFSLADIQTVVKDWESAGSATGAMVKVRDVYKKKLDETRATIRRLEALEHEIRASLAYLDTCDVCDPERLVTACKACDLHDCHAAVPDLVAGFRASTL